MLSASTLATIAGKPENANMRSTILGLKMGGAEAGLNLAHRVAQYFAQLGHESNGWHYDREIWGPTAAQERYDTRTDLGNTAARDGDGYFYRGRTPLQVTGKANYRYFTQWARDLDPAAPDFVENPDAILTDPWEGLAGIWFWDRNDLNLYADAGNIEMVTHRVNGGLNGYADRLRWYDRSALVLLGYAPDAVRVFQGDAKIAVDGISGPVTRAALHKALGGLDPYDDAPAPLQGADAALAEIREIINRHYARG